MVKKITTTWEGSSEKTMFSLEKTGADKEEENKREWDGDLGGG
jgi:hypothetical protein